MTSITPELRLSVEKRAHGCCEYCQTSRLIVVTMEIDHIIPTAAGGLTTEDNLCFVCRGCNAFKQHHQTGIDPETGLEIPLYNPRTQKWADHFAWSFDSTEMIGLTAVGRATAARLRVNREEVITARRLWVSAGWHPPPKA